MRCVKILLLFVFPMVINNLSAAADADVVTTDVGSEMYKDVKKLSDNLYSAKMPGELNLVMERVDDSNIELWKHYIKIQGYGVYRLRDDLVQHGIGGHFLRVLNETDSKKNEIWVAYITSGKPQKIPQEIRHYDSTEREECNNTFAKDIKMFVTVTSSPNALITSHMGVGASIESQRVGRPKGISVDLHSFAAKVMLIRNPKRLYQVNAPVYAMEKIFLDTMPAGAIFVGTKEMQANMIERREISFEVFKQQNISKYNEEKEKRRTKLVKKAENLAEMFLEVGDVDFDETDKEIMKLMDKNAKGEYVLNPVRVEGYLNPIMLSVMGNLYNRFKNPYFFENASGDDATIKLLKCMEMHPPLISIGNKLYPDDHFTIFDRHHQTVPWLTVNKSNPDYDWMFADPFCAAPGTHYIVVDLKALADARPVVAF